MISQVTPDTGAANLPAMLQGIAGLFAVLMKESAAENIGQKAADDSSPAKCETKRVKLQCREEDVPESPIAEDTNSSTNPLIVPTVPAGIVVVPNKVETGEVSQSGASAQHRLTGAEQPNDVTGSEARTDNNKTGERSGLEGEATMGQRPIELVAAASQSGPDLQRELRSETTSSLAKILDQDGSSVVDRVEPSQSMVAKTNGQELPGPELNAASNMAEAKNVTRSAAGGGKHIEAEKQVAVPRNSTRSEGSQLIVELSAPAARTGESRAREMTSELRSSGDVSPMMTRLEAAEPRSGPSMALNVERLVERLAGPEMKFTVHLNDSGNVQVSAHLHERSMQLGMVADRAETASALHSEVPYLETRIRSQSLELGEVRISLQQASTMNSGYSGEQRSRQEWRGESPVMRMVDQEAGQRGEGLSYATGTEQQISGWLA